MPDSLRAENTFYEWYQTGTIRLWLSTYGSLPKTTGCCLTLPKKMVRRSNKLSFGSSTKSGIEKLPGVLLTLSLTGSMRNGQLS